MEDSNVKSAHHSTITATDNSNNDKTKVNTNSEHLITTHNDDTHSHNNSNFMVQFESERLEAFCDAVLAIIATILVTPLKLTDNQIVEHSLRFQLSRLHNNVRLPVFGVNLLYFIIVFFLIKQSWLYHIKVFKLFPNVDHVVICLNFLFLVGSSFSPTATVLLKSAITPGSVGMLFLSSIITSFALVAQIAYGYFTRKRFKTEIQVHLKTVVYLTITIMIKSIYLFVAFLLSFSSSEYGPYTVSSILGLVNYSNSLIDIIYKIKYRRKRKNLELSPADIQIHELNKTIPKNRLEFFSDAVYSIVCTLVILDATTSIQNNIVATTSRSTTQSPYSDLNSDVNKVLNESRFSFYSFLSSFCIVCYFWYIHHAMFHCVKRVTIYVYYLNSLSLVMVCLIPFCSNILVGYSKIDDGKIYHDNFSLALQISTSIISIIGILFFLIWLLIRYSKQNSYSSHLNNISNVQMIFRIILLPVISLVLYMVSIFPANGLTLVSFFIVLIVAFIVLILIESFYPIYFSVLNIIQKLRRQVPKIEKYNSNSSRLQPLI